MRSRDQVKGVPQRMMNPGEKRANISVQRDSSVLLCACAGTSGAREPKATASVCVPSSEQEKEEQTSPVHPLQAWKPGPGESQWVLVRAGGVTGTHVPATQPHPTQESSNKQPHHPGRAPSLWRGLACSSPG